MYAWQKSIVYFIRTFAGTAQSIIHNCPELAPRPYFPAALTRCPILALASWLEVKGARAKFVAGMTVLRLHSVSKYKEFLVN